MNFRRHIGTAGGAVCPGLPAIRNGAWARLTTLHRTACLSSDCGGGATAAPALIFRRGLGLGECWALQAGLAADPHKWPACTSERQDDGVYQHIIGPVRASCARRLALLGGDL